MSWPSGPANIVELHEAIPDTESVPWKVRLTGWLNQPLWSGGRSGMNDTTDGGVRSMPIQTVFRTSVESDQLTVQRCSTGVVSAVNVLAEQPLTIIPPGSSCQETDTHGVVYQRLQWSRPNGKSQLATTSCACAVAGPERPAITTATATMPPSRRWPRQAFDTLPLPRRPGARGARRLPLLGEGTTPKVVPHVKAVNYPGERFKTTLSEREPGSRLPLRALGAVPSAPR